MNKNRIGILVFYDEEGVVDDYFIFILKSLKIVCTQIIVTVNGIIDKSGYDKISALSDNVLIRDNTGFDAGAYYDVIINRIGKDDLSRYDELILCNDTFYGPFFGFQVIFDKMSCKDCDYWGLNYIESSLIGHMESYFLVFKNSLLRSGFIYDYFLSLKTPYTNDLNKTIVDFEDGLSMQLEESGYKKACYIQPNNINLYKNGEELISEYGFPIIKKKFFSKKYNKDYYTQNKALIYLKNNTAYNVEYIINNAKRMYDYSYEPEMIIKTDHCNKINKYSVLTNLSRSGLQDFIKRNDQIYIYGIGFWGERLYNMYFNEHKDKVNGFIVSNSYADSLTDSCFHGVPVFSLSRVNNRKDAGVLIAMTKESSKEVLSGCIDFKEVLSIW